MSRGFNATDSNKLRYFGDTTLVGNRAVPIAGWSQWTAIGLPAVASIVGLVKIVQINGVASKLQANAGDGTLGGAMAGLVAQAVRPRFGLYVLVMAGLAAAVAAVLLNPQRLTKPSNMASFRGLKLPRLGNLPMHAQRLAVVLFSVLGMSCVFMPWLSSVDQEAVYRIKNVSSASTDEIAEAREINLKYAEEMGRQMGKKAGRLQDIYWANGFNLAGLLTVLLFGTATYFGLNGIRSDAIIGRLRLFVVVPALIASSIGIIQVFRAGSADVAVREAVQEYVRSRGHRENLVRLERPVLDAGFGVWLAIATGIATVVAVYRIKPDASTASTST